MSLGFNKVKVKSTSSSSVKDDVKKNETTSSSSVKDEIIKSKDSQYIIRSLDQTKASIDEAAERARNQIPVITKIVNDYQQQTIQASEDIANDFLKSQKEIINSVESVWIPIVENFQNRYWSYSMTPSRVTESYTRAVDSITDFTSATSRLINNTIYSNLETFKIVMQSAQENAKELSRISTNAAKTLGNMT